MVRRITLLRVWRKLTFPCISIYVVRTMHPDITHHLVPSHAITPPRRTSLLSAVHLVKPEWLSELLDLALLDPRESSRALGHTFALPLRVISSWLHRGAPLSTEDVTIMGA